MIGLYDLVAARLGDPARCPNLIQVTTTPRASAAVEMLALNADVTALVGPLSDEANPVQGGSMRVGQVENELFGVTMAMLAPAGVEQFELAREQIKTALRGWMPEGAATPIAYVAGATLSYDLKKDGGRWLHLLRFRVSTVVTYEASL